MSAIVKAAGAEAPLGSSAASLAVGGPAAGLVLQREGAVAGSGPGAGVGGGTASGGMLVQGKEAEAAPALAAFEEVTAGSGTFRGGVGVQGVGGAWEAEAEAEAEARTVRAHAPALAVFDTMALAALEEGRGGSGRLGEVGGGDGRAAGPGGDARGNGRTAPAGMGGASGGGGQGGVVGVPEAERDVGRAAGETGGGGDEAGEAQAVGGGVGPPEHGSRGWGSVWM